MSSPVEVTELYDNALLGILQHVGNIQNFLQVYFGFLYRKTDFYRLLSGPQDRMGFPPGVAEKMVFKFLQLSLSKTGEVWWSAVLKGEAEIDVNQINRERTMATVDEEEHAVLDRLSFDYHQKLQGRPQSHEIKVHEMLKKGWDAEGSPFKGQDFDPSMFNIPHSAVQF
ncbi:nudC domain-containing protein 3-like [Sinocyclocheilus anshuiensis]|uniref:nudC domain-containing protein 3-like n=1 Tax=Sinocyclocheilus anshuiensis TaxID=1608454 RepID=UPI0007B935B6|nr:PREDICTED: nudC domain-containing protein 3-like [Sinocyclocheilus anshuiensis]